MLKIRVGRAHTTKKLPSPYDILYKTLFGSKLQCIRFDEANVFVRVYDGTRYYYLVLKKAILFTIEFDILLAKKGITLGITFSFSHNYAKIKIDSYDSLPLEKTLTVSNVIILSK